MSNSEQFDFHRVCRTCLSSENLQSLFGHYLQHARIDDMLTLCTSVKYSANDGLPVQICGDCIAELRRSYQFALKCRQTDDKLRTYKQKLVPQIYATPHYLNAAKPLSVFVKTELDVKQENISDTEDQTSTDTPMLPELAKAYESNEIPISCIPIITESQLISLDYKRARSTQVKPYSCVVCSKSFSQQHDLTRHVRTHTGEKPYSCLMCKKQFNRKTNLNMHMRVHTVTKQYSCKTCCTSFNRQQCLIRHLCKHTGEKPYPCTVCDKSFNQSHDLKRHLRTHTGEKPYSCTVCGRSFTRKTYLRVHLQKHHYTLN